MTNGARQFVHVMENAKIVSKQSMIQDACGGGSLGKQRDRRQYFLNGVTSTAKILCL
jgi:hypothetical protein